MLSRGRQGTFWLKRLISRRGIENLGLRSRGGGGQNIHPTASHPSLLCRGLLQKNAQRLGRGTKLKRAGNAGKGREKGDFFPAFPLPTVPRAPLFSLQHSRSRIFLSLVCTNRSLCGGESPTPKKRITFSLRFCRERTTRELVRRNATRGCSRQIKK